MENKEQKEAKVDLYKYTIILDKISPDTKAEEIDESLKTGKFKFKQVEKISPESYDTFGIESKYNVSMNRINQHHKNDK